MGVPLSTLGKAAIDYARQGFEVLPLFANEKRPLTEHGFYEATTDEETIHKWWMKYPEANIGLRVSGIILDIDNKGGKVGSDELKKYEKLLGSLPPTLAVRTPNDGVHFYFESFDAPWGFKKELAPGIDIKVKGYVVAPPSKLESGEYTFVRTSKIATMPDKWMSAVQKEEPTDTGIDRIRKHMAVTDDGTICERYDLKMDDVMHRPAGAQTVEDGYRCRHPVHGGTNPTNIHVNTRDNLWFCFHHDVGGDPLTWVAVREGIINCEDAENRLAKDQVKQCLGILKAEGTISEVVADIPKEDREIVEELAQWLIKNPKELVAFYRWTLDDYHFGEWALKTTLFRGGHRIAFSDVAALLHFDLTGKSRTGKTSLVNKYLNIIPPERQEVLTSASPKSIWYKTQQWQEKYVPRTDKETGEDLVDKHGNVLTRRIRTKVPDPAYYVGKFIVFMELADMKDPSVLKALADEYETGFTHSTVIDKESVEFVIGGARSVITASVSGVQNDEAKQVLNRFIQAPLEESDVTRDMNKIMMVLDHDLCSQDMRKDWRCHVLRRAIEVLYQDGDKVVTTPPTEEVKSVARIIATTLFSDGFNITQIRQFYSLALCGAFEKRFSYGDGGIMQLQKEDLLEAWYIMCAFGQFTKANLTRPDLKILETIAAENYGKEIDYGTTGENYTQEELEFCHYATASDIRKTTRLASGTINKALRVTANNQDLLGKFLEYGYVDHQSCGIRHATVFWLTEEGKTCVKEVTQKLDMENIKEIEVLIPKKLTTEQVYEGDTLKPLNPCAVTFADLVSSINENVGVSLDSFSRVNHSDAYACSVFEKDDLCIPLSTEYNISSNHKITSSFSEKEKVPPHDPILSESVNRHVDRQENSQNQRISATQPSCVSNMPSSPNEFSGEKEPNLPESDNGLSTPSTKREKRMKPNLPKSDSNLNTDSTKRHDGHKLPPLVSQIHAAQLIYDILHDTKTASSTGKLKFNYNQLKELVCSQIRKEHPEAIEYDFESAFDKFADDDPRTKKLVLEFTQKK